MTANPPDLSEVRRVECELDGLYFARYFMKNTTGTKMILGWHHRVMQEALDRTMLPHDDPEFISRLVINVPPGFTKTMLASIYYMARGLALNPRNRFLHLSYSSDLALQNSSATRDIIRSTEFQAMWQVKTKDDTDSKRTWWTVDNGGIRAASSKGQVTGFRAGHMDAGVFTGSCVIDDPLKPEDAISEVKRTSINDGYNETIASRLAVETVPVIVIMQRVHYDDLSGHLLRGGSGEMWHHLNLPVVINDDPYPEENTHSIPIEHGLSNGWLWPYKLNSEHEVALRAHRRKWHAQYMQAPKKRDSELMIWQEEDIKQAHGEPWVSPATRTVIAIDPAATNTKTSDECGIGAASYHGPNKYTIIQDLSKRATPKKWAETAIYLYETLSASAIVIETNQGGDMAIDTLRNAGFKGRILGVHASKGKVTRAEPIAALYSQGFVRHAPGLTKLEDEMLDFDPVTGLSNGKSPNRVDWAVWALTELSKHGKFMVS